MTSQPEMHTPRLLPLSEYLDLISMGTFALPPPGRLVQAAITAAQSVWPHTGLQAYQTQAPRVVSAFSAANGRLTLCHISAGPPNCFLILALDAASLEPESYIVLDLGAEYAKPILRCPSLPYLGPATQTAICAGLPGLRESSEAFIKIETGPGTYLQASQGPDGQYALEHQLVTPENRYEAAEAMDIATAVRTLRSYAFGQFEWASAVNWRHAGAQQQSARHV